MRASGSSRNSLTGILVGLSEINDEHFRLLEESFTSEKSFDIGAAERARLATEISKPQALVAHFANALGFLYRHVQDRGAPDQNIRDVVADVLIELDVADFIEERQVVRLTDRLAQVLRPSQNHERYLKVSRLESGFLPRLVSASTFMDLRPGFDAGRTTVECLVPLVQLNITTDSGRPDEANMIVQLDLKGVEILRQTLDDVDAKIRAINSHTGFNAPILTSGDDS